MSKVKRSDQITKINIIDFFIVVIAICAPYILDGIRLGLAQVIPVFEIGIIPKHIITVSVLFLRIAIVRGQKPHTDNSLSIVGLFLWVIIWLLLGNELDLFFTSLLLKTLIGQIIYWILFPLIVFFFLIELGYQKKKVIDKDTKENLLLIKKVDSITKEIKEEVKGVDKATKSKRSKLKED